MYRKPLCHKGPVEVHKNLFCGGEGEAIRMTKGKNRVDTLVPLLVPAENLLHFRGELLLYPIQDYSVLHIEVLEELTTGIVNRLNNGKKVGIFCMGGHGRTGYVTSAVLGKLGYDDPIGFLRANYCEKAVESMEQLQQIADFLDKPDLVCKYQKSVDNLSVVWMNFGNLTDDDSYYLTEDYFNTCGGCAFYHKGKCDLYQIKMDANEMGCEEFTSVLFF